MHSVDLDESFPTSVYLQKLASIQPRTSPKKFESSSSREFELKLQKCKPLFCSPGDLPTAFSDDAVDVETHVQEGVKQPVVIGDRREVDDDQGPGGSGLAESGQT